MKRIKLYGGNSRLFGNIKMKYKCANCGHIFIIDTNSDSSCPNCMKAVIYSWSNWKKCPAMHMVVPLEQIPDNYAQGETIESHTA